MQFGTSSVPRGHRNQRQRTGGHTNPLSNWALYYTFHLVTHGILQELLFYTEAEYHITNVFKILIENRQNPKYYAETRNHDTDLLRIGKMSTIRKKATSRKSQFPAQQHSANGHNCWICRSSHAKE